MTDWLSGPLDVGVTFILQIINTFAHIDFPGTNIPIVIVMLSPVALILVWRVFLSWIFDMRGD